MALIGFSLAVVMGAGLGALLASLRPQWRDGPRLLVAASFLPLVTLATTVAAILFIASAKPAGGGDMHDLAIRAVAAYGAIFFGIAFAGGLTGALLTRARRRS